MQSTPARRPARRFPLAIVGVLLLFGITPVVGMIVITRVLDRGCSILDAGEGEAVPNLLWRIEREQCGTGPGVWNVLVAPRGKTMALAASLTGSPHPQEVTRTPEGIVSLVLDGAASDGTRVRLLPLKGTGRPARPLVLRDGMPVR